MCALSYQAMRLRAAVFMFLAATVSRAMRLDRGREGVFAVAVTGRAHRSGRDGRVQVPPMVGDGMFMKFLLRAGVTISSARAYPWLMEAGHGKISITMAPL